MKRLRYVRSLDELDEEPVESVGGKAKGLAELRGMGLTVPDGFVLLTSAYRQFVQRNGLQHDIHQLLGVMSGDGGEERLREMADRLRRSFMANPVPPEVSGEIEEGCRRLGVGPVAVRSSARGEDSPEASFAGQHDSFLNVEGSEGVLRAVRACWASLFNFRALSYRRQSGIRSGDAALAVVIQKMVDSDRSGVMFTADPVSGRRDRVVINASWGLGESVVSGSVTPDQWTLHKETCRVLQSTITDKESMIVPADEGTCEKQTPADLRDRPALSEREAAALARKGAEIEKHLGWPQDVEWAVRDGEFYFLQSRPVTGLYPLPEAPEEDRAAGAHYCLSLGAQGVVEPMTPMGIDVFCGMYEWVRPLYSSMMRMEAPPLREVGGRLYWDMTEVLQSDSLRDNLLGCICIVDPEGPVILGQFWDENRDKLQVETDPGGFTFPPLSTLIMLLGVGVRLTGGILFVLASPRRAVPSLISLTDRAIDRLAEQAAGLEDIAERLQFVAELSQKTVDIVLNQASALYVGLGALFLCRRKLNDWFGDEQIIEPVLRWLPNNPTTEMGVRLRRAAAQSVSEGGEIDPDAAEFQQFLRQYGHRAVTEIDVGVPRWREDPSQVVEMAESLLSGDGQSGDRRAEGSAEARRQMRDIVARTREERGALSARLMSFLLHRVRQLVGLRERPKFDMVRIFDICRQVLKGVGEQLVEQGRLDDPQDVFFVTKAEINKGGDLRSEAENNRRQYRREMRRKRVPLVITDCGEALYTAEREGDALTGTPVSPGVYEGPVRVVHHPRGVRLKEGEVLVAPATDPGWTPLFLSAGALIMEVGGMMSHGSGVAREYGIPGVGGLAGATGRLRDGQQVRVNGNTGKVVLLDD